jgi:hypothetical protein
MEISERGRKHACVDCGIKYYDLNKAVVACPRCGAPPAPGKLLKSNRGPTRPVRRTTGFAQRSG